MLGLKINDALNIKTKNLIHWKKTEKVEKRNSPQGLWSKNKCLFTRFQYCSLIIYGDGFHFPVRHRVFLAFFFSLLLADFLNHFYVTFGGLFHLNIYYVCINIFLFYACGTWFIMAVYIYHSSWKKNKYAANINVMMGILFFCTFVLLSHFLNCGIVICGRCFVWDWIVWFLFDNWLCGT